ncbi:MAG: hypothetical protein WCK01_00855 [Candidatus Uhrbacteria bacterium]
MSNTSRWLIGSVMVIVLGAVFLSNGLLPTVAKGLPRVKNNFLTTIGKIMPSGQDPKYLFQIQNGLAVIGVEESKDFAEDHALSLYTANSKTGSLTPLVKRDLSGPGHNISFEVGEFSKVLRVETMTQWEGYDDRYADYIRIDDGTLAFTTRYQNGQAVILTHDGTSLDITLAPKEGCDSNSVEPARTVNITGVIVNGKELSFKKSYPVTCSISEMMSAGFYPDIQEPWYSGDLTAQGAEYAYVSLPFGASLRIDLKKFSAEAITLIEN